MTELIQTEMIMIFADIEKAYNSRNRKQAILFVVYFMITSDHVKITPYAACGNNGQARGKIADKT
jgi:hypothetical protein